MFRTLAQVSVRRCLHTSAVRRVTRPGRLGYALGASAAVTAYLAWNSQSIALDSPGPSSNHAAPLTPKGSVSPEAITSSHSTALEHEPSIYDHQETSHTRSESEDTPSAQPDLTEATVESESGGGGAFNPVTGEINWDCPCLGGMAHGPCGMQFREAFSCFVFSEKEPKGIDCVERFKAMQSCFREHPDVYGDDIMDDDDDDDVSPASVDTTSGPDETQSTQLQPEPSISVSTPSAAEETTAA